MVMVKQQQDERPTLKQCSQGRKCCRGKPVHREVGGHLDHQSAKSHSFQVDDREATSLGGRQSISPGWITTPSQSEIKSVSNNCNCSSTSRTTTPSQSEISGFLPKHYTISHRKTRKLTTSTLRAISSASKTHRTLLKPPPPRNFPGQRSTLSFTNLAQSRLIVLRTFLSFTLTVLTDLAHLRENMTLKWTLQCHQFNMQGGRC